MTVLSNAELSYYYNDPHFTHEDTVEKRLNNLYEGPLKVAPQNPSPGQCSRGPAPPFPWSEAPGVGFSGLLYRLTIADALSLGTFGELFETCV